jgi:succinyl-diaminopimelate desuccinylase
LPIFWQGQSDAWKQKVRKRKEGKIMEQEAICLTQQMVRIDSTNPGKGEAEMEHFLLDFAQKINADFIEIQTEEVSKGRRNVMLTIPGEEKNSEMVFICHMDTVPANEGWETDPFSGEIVGERLYGRGSCDMKSGFACALSAFHSVAKRCKEEGAVPKRTLKLIGTVDEEGDMTGVEKAICSGWVSKDSFVLDTEPTNGQIQVAHKGRVWFAITVEGITAHASTPWKGADAIAAMAEVISYLRKEFTLLEEYPGLGKSTITFGRIWGGTQPYVVSDRCTVTVDMRLVPPYTSKWAEELVKKSARLAENTVSGAKVSWQITGDRPYIEKNEDSRLLAQLKEACETVTGVPVQVSAFNGYTDTAVIAGKLGNRECMSYGPGDLEMAHKPNEYVRIEEIIRCEKVLTQLAFQMTENQRRDSCK